MPRSGVSDVVHSLFARVSSGLSDFAAQPKILHPIYRTIVSSARESSEQSEMSRDINYIAFHS